MPRRVVNSVGGADVRTTDGRLALFRLAKEGRPAGDRTNDGSRWKFPVDGLPAENVRRGVRVTRQTGQVLTPTASPGDTEVACLSDSGGHANLWVVNTESGGLRQITHERDPNVALGVPANAARPPRAHSARGLGDPRQRGCEIGCILAIKRGVAMPVLDWSQCRAVESVPGKMSGAWVLRNTRMPVATIFENLEAGANIDDILAWYDGLDRDQVKAVIEFAARSLDMSVAGR